MEAIRTPNPWLDEPDDEEPVEPLRPATAHSAPRISVEFTGGLPPGPSAPPGKLAVVAAHGGAGATSWAHLLGAFDSETHWPAPGWTPTSAVVVARHSRSGLEAARAAGLQWASGGVPEVKLIGLILTPDIPGRLPKQLREADQQVRGIYPRVFDMPFKSEWRLCLPNELAATGRAAQIITDITGQTR